MGVKRFPFEWQVELMANGAMSAITTGHIVKTGFCLAARFIRQNHMNPVGILHQRNQGYGAFDTSSQPHQFFGEQPFGGGLVQAQKIGVFGWQTAQMQFINRLIPSRADGGAMNADPFAQKVFHYAQAFKHFHGTGMNDGRARLIGGLG